MATRIRLGTLLVDAKLLTAEDLEATLAAQKADGRRLGTLLVERGLLNETQLTQILSHQLAVPWVSLLHIEFSRQLLNLVPQDVADRFCLVPIYVRHVRNQGETLYVAMDDPTNEEGLKACADHSGLPVRAMIAPPQDIRSAIRVYYGAPRPPSIPAPEEVAPPPEPEAEAPPEPETPPEPEAEAPPEPPADEAPAPPVEEPEHKPRPPSDSIEVDFEADAPPPPAEEPAAEEAAARVEEPEPPAIEPPPPPEVEIHVRESSPEIRAFEIPVPPRSRRPAKPRLAINVPTPASEEPPSTSRPVEQIPQPKGRAPRMVALTLLDGTTLTLPAKPKRRDSSPPEPESARPPPAEVGEEDHHQQLTARDLVAALRAVSHGADATEILGKDHRWEQMFAALLSLLLRKHLIADWEFVDELKKI